jgi:hypothetical protein
LDQKDEYRLNTLTKLLLEKYGFKAYLDTEEIAIHLRASTCEVLYADVISTGNFIRTKLQVHLLDCQQKVLYQSAIGSSKEKEYKIAYTQALRSAFLSFDGLKKQSNPQEKVNNQEEKSEPLTVKSAASKEELLPVVLRASPIPNGYELKDAQAKLVMKLMKTSNPETFAAVKDSIQGVLIQKEGKWYFEYYQNDSLQSELVNIQF